MAPISLWSTGYDCRCGSTNQAMVLEVFYHALHYTQIKYRQDTDKMLWLAWDHKEMDDKNLFSSTKKVELEFEIHKIIN